MKKVLMIAYYFPPLGGGGVQRSVKYVKYLQKFGWFPVVLTTSNTFFWKHDETLWKDVPKSVPVYRAPLAVPITLAERIRTILHKGPGTGTKGRPPATRSGGFHRFMKKIAGYVFLPDIYCSWIPFSVMKALWIIRKENPDIIYTTSPPESSHVIGLILKKLTGIPWIADFRDPWVEGISFWTPSRYHLKLHEFLEDRVIQLSDRVVTTTERAAAAFMEKRPELPGDKFSVITNGFDEDDYDSPPRPVKGKFVISHTGMLSLKRTSYYFLLGLSEFLRKYPEARSKLEVRFIGVRETSNDRFIKRFGLTDVVVNHGLLSHSETIENQLESHLLLLIETDTVYSDQVIPGKLFDYIGAMRPVLALLPEGAAAELVRESGIGKVVEATDVNAITAALEYYYNEFENGELFKPVPARNRSRFLRRILTGKLAGVMNDCSKPAE